MARPTDKTALLSSSGRVVGGGSSVNGQRAVTVEDVAVGAKDPSSVPSVAELQSASDIAGKQFTIRAVAYVFGYFAVGSVVYTQWGNMNLINALYFCVVTLTTIGFGDLTNTPSLRWFATVYVLVGISFAASALAFVAGRILERQERLIATHIEKEKKSKLSRSDTMRSMAKGFSLRPSFIPDQYANVYNSGMTFVILVGIGVFVFVQWQGLNVRDALYMLIVAATTVGYGDVAPDTDMLKLFSVVYLPMLSLCMGKLAGDFADLQISGKQDEIKERFLKRTLRKEDFLAMDADGDGQIDKFEWLSSTLIEQGTISPSDLQHIMSRFEELDADGTGAIDAKEAGVL